MAAPFKQVQPVLARIAAHLEQDLRLAALAKETARSPFHQHRMFSAVTGETPKRFSLRLRLGRAAVMLLTSRDSILEIALSCGFQSHEVFCRAFRRHFGILPRAYRTRGFAGNVDGPSTREHAALVSRIGPCVGLYHRSEEIRVKNDTKYSVMKKDLTPQPVLVMRRRVKRSEIAATIGGSLPSIFQYAQERGIALAGHPFTRYIDMGPGLITMEPGMRIVASGPETTGIELDKVAVDTLPGGAAAVVMHAGPYDSLPEAYAAIEEWMAAQGLKAGGAPWESYITDPAAEPDPKNWKTEVFWPLARP